MKIALRTMLRGTYINVALINVALGLLLLSFSAAAQDRQFTVRNNCSETVWLAGAGNPIPVFNGSPGGLEMAPGASVTTTVPVPWVAGRFWGRPAHPDAIALAKLSLVKRLGHMFVLDLNNVNDPDVPGCAPITERTNQSNRSKLVFAIER